LGFDKDLLGTEQRVRTKAIQQKKKKRISINFYSMMISSTKSQAFFNSPD
jgi:hypothetical protein